MTSNGVASNGVQAVQRMQQERTAEQAALRRNDDVQEQRGKEPLPVTEPEQVPPQVYNAKGKLVPSPALSAVDLTA